MFGRCKQCDETLDRLEAIEDQVEKFALDYELLYEKVRVGLSRLARLTDKAESEISDKSYLEEEDGLDPVSRRIQARRRRGVLSARNKPSAAEG